MTQAYEIATSELTTLRRTIAAQSELLQDRKKPKSGSRIKNKGKFIYSTQEVLHSTREAETKTARKKLKRDGNPQALIERNKDMQVDILENEDSDSGSSGIIIVARR